MITFHETHIVAYELEQPGEDVSDMEFIGLFEPCEFVEKR
jgi:hypothetical protein